MCNDTLCNITIDEEEVLDIITVILVNKAIVKLFNQLFLLLLNHLLGYLIDLCQKRFLHLFMPRD